MQTRKQLNNYNQPYTYDIENYVKEDSPHLLLLFFAWYFMTMGGYPSSSPGICSLKNKKSDELPLESFMPCHLDFIKQLHHQPKVAAALATLHGRRSNRWSFFSLVVRKLKLLNRPEINRLSFFFYNILILHPWYYC